MLCQSLCVRIQLYLSVGRALTVILYVCASISSVQRHWVCVYARQAATAHFPPLCSPSPSVSPGPSLSLCSSAPPGSLQLLKLLHPVEGAAGVEPLDLVLVEGVVQGDYVLAAVTVLHHSLQGLEEKDSWPVRHPWKIHILPSPIPIIWREVILVAEWLMTLTLPGAKVARPMMESLSSGRILS